MVLSAGPAVWRCGTSNHVWQTWADSKRFGLIGGLGVGATEFCYEQIAAACAARGLVPRMTIACANAPTALAHFQAGRTDEMADCHHTGDLTARVLH